MLNLERLRVLHAVWVGGSVRAAAETLHVTTSAVSQQLARLEREIGEPLVERNGRGIRLTDAGSVLAGHATRLLDQVERVEADLAGRRGAVAGTVTIAAFATAARGLLPDAVTALRAEHPELTVRVSEMEPSEAIPALCRTDIDIAVVQDWADAPLRLPDGLSRKHLVDDELDIAVPAGHRLAARHNLTLAELSAEDWITWTSGQICHDWLREAMRDQTTPPTIAHTASEHSTQLALVAAGMGIAILPRLGRGPVPDGVRIIPVLPRLTRRVHAVWRTTAAARPAIGAAVRTLATPVR